MALPSTIYRVNLQLSDVDRGIYESLQATVARHPSETEERLVARLLAYVIFFEPDLAFSKGVGSGDEPDFWLKGPDDRVLLWVEVGLPEADRIIKASRHAERVGLIACGRALPKWEQQHLAKLEGVANLALITFDHAFIGSLVGSLNRSINWAVTINDGNLYINAGDDAFEAPLEKLVGRW